MAKPKNSPSQVDQEANDGLVDESYDDNFDAQAGANADKEDVGDASDHAKDRGAEKGDVDVVEQTEKNSKSVEERIKDAQDRKTEKDDEKKDLAEKRDEGQKESLKRAYGEGMQQPVLDDRLDVVRVREAADVANEGWTVQSENSYIAGPSGEVGQAFVKAQLPNREVQRKAGIDPDQQTAALTVLDDDSATEDIYSGPEPSEARNLGLIK